MQKPSTDPESVPSASKQTRDFDMHSAPNRPQELFQGWLQDALDAGVPQARAATLSTVDTDGFPDARVLTVRNVSDGCGFKFATSDNSPKGQQLLANPNCALTFYWGQLSRVVRIRGIAEQATTEESAKDFLARHPKTRANALAAPQSSVIPSEAVRAELLAQAESDVELDPEIAYPPWTVWTVQAKSVEFWQGDPDRNHQRLSYLRTENAWDKQLLWP